MSKFVKEEAKQVIGLQMELLKRMLQETGTAIGFDKKNDKFLFFDREHYIKTGKMEGFGIDFKELSY